VTGSVIGRARVEIEPTYGNVRAGLARQFNQSANEFRAHGRNAGTQFSGGFGTAVKGTEKAAEESGRRGGLRFIGGFTSRIGPRAFAGTTGVMTTGLTGMAGAATSAGLALTAVAGAGVAAGTALGVKTAASLEQSQVAFTTLLHSSTKAKDFLADLSKFAAATPFTMPGLVDASRQLLGVGASAQSVIPTLTAWGDTSGALGLSQEQFSRTMIALTQSMANGKIQAGDMLQITQAGIPIWAILARSLGKPVAEVRKLSEGGKLLTADVLPKLQAQMEKDYGGSMEKQSKTLTGVWSTFTDTLSMGLATAVQPLIPALKTGLTGAIGVVGRALGSLPALGARIGPVFRTIKADVSAFIAGFRSGVDFHRFGIVGAIEGFGASARRVFNRVHAAWVDVQNGFRGNTASGPLSQFGTVFVRVGSAVQTGLTWVRQIPGAVRTAGEAAGRYLLPAFRDYGRYITGGLIPTLGNLVAIFRGTILPAIRPIAIVVGVTLLVAFRTFAFLLANVVGPTLRVVTGFLRQHQTAVTAVAITIGVLVAGYKLYQFTLFAVNAVQKIFAAGMLLVRGAIMSVRIAMFLLRAAFLANPIGIVTLAILALAAGLIYAYKHSETFRAVVSAGWRFIANTASSFWNSFLKPIFQHFSDAIGRIQRAWHDTGAQFQVVWAGLKEAFRLGVSFILGYIDNVLGGFATLLRAAGHLPGPLGKPFRDAADKVDAMRGKVKTLQDGINNTHGKNVTVGVAIKGNVTVGVNIKGNIIAVAGGNSGTGGRAIRIASGGFVSGPWMGPRADNVMAMVNPREFVVQAPAAMALEQRHPGFLSGVINRAHELPLGGDPSGAWIPRSGKSGIPGLADGGFVLPRGAHGYTPAVQELYWYLRHGGRIFEDFSFRGASNYYRNRNDDLAAFYYQRGTRAHYGGGWAASPEAWAARWIHRVQHGRPAMGLAKGGWTNTAGGWVVPRFADGGLITRIQQWGAAQDPKPYVWGAVGPNAYDCSGIAGNVWAMATGNPMYRRYFVTANESSFDGLRPGRGTITFGVNPGQHTAVNVAGFGIEAQSTATGIKTGGAATPVTSFQRQLYLPEAGGTFISGGAGFNAPMPITVGELRRIMAGLEPQILASVAREMGLKTFDTGGGKRWPSGTLGGNFSGQDEFVYKRGDLLTGAGGMNLTLHVDARGAHDPQAVEAAVERAGARLMNELALLMRQRPGVN
jgi:tape measure domain-containing protein